MSRIGVKPVPVPEKAAVSVTGREVAVEAEGQRLTITHRPEVSVRVEEDPARVVVERKVETREARAYHGLTRALIANMIQGVTEGFVRELEINGVGWTAQVQDQRINLNIGYADTRVLPIPRGLRVEVNQNRIRVAGADKQAVGQLAARIRGQRPPEPYNGKGIKYADEVIQSKQGKAFASG